MLKYKIITEAFSRLVSIVVSYGLDWTYARYDHLVHSATDTFRALPPSQGALKQHILRSAFVAGHLWGKADEPNPILPDVTEWGWCYSDNEDLIPVWTLQHDDTVYKACKKKCNCGEKNNCLKGNCSCTGTKCLPTCKCRGGCGKDNDQQGVSFQHHYSLQLFS